MKELTIEEKAKAYDEAYKRVAVRFGSNVADEIFPELKESEDERIRKEIVKFIVTTPKERNNHKKWLAWLEKQGEKDEEILVLKDKIESLHAAIKAIKETHRIELEKQGEQKQILDVEIPFGAKDSELQEATYYIPKGFHAKIEGDKVVIKKGEQKPAIIPKFSLGDRICSNIREYTVYEICDDYYRLFDDERGAVGMHLLFKDQDKFRFVEQKPDDKFERPTIKVKDDVSVSSRMQYIDNELKPIAEFIMEYASWNLHKEEWNHPVLEVPLFRVLDALIQRGKPYCGG